MLIFNKSVLEKILGYAGCTTISFIIDDIFWPAAVIFFGSIMGGIIMTAIALIINLILIWLYDYLKKDLFGFENLKLLRESSGKGFWIWLIKKAFKIGRIPAFIVLSYYDPFLAVIYMRKDAHCFSMRLKDWIYFIISMLIASAGFTVFWSLIIEAVKISWLSLFSV